MVRARETVALRVERELSSVVGEAVLAIRAAIPAYRDLHGPQLADVEGIAYWSLRRLMQIWNADTAELDDRDRARFLAIGVARASDGRPLSDVLRAYRVASSVFIRHIASVHLADLDPADIAELSIAALDGIDAISEEIIGAYTAARERLASDGEHARSALLDDLLAGRQNSPGALADRSRELALTLPTHPTVLVVGRADSTDTVRHEDLDNVLGALGGDRATEDAQLATRRDHRSVFLLPAAVDLAGVDAVCAERYLRGSAVARRPITEVSASYRLAADGLGAAPEHAFDDRAVLDEGDNQLLALLTARPYADTNAVVAAVLGTLTEPAHNHLLAGLSAFIATGTATEAAAALHVHPQTLRYRLRRAREVTGRDPRRAWHRLALDTALQLRQLQRPT